MEKTNTTKFLGAFSVSGGGGGDIDTSKFVTTDTAQDITGSKNFTTGVSVSGEKVLNVTDDTLNTGSSDLKLDIFSQGTPNVVRDGTSYFNTDAGNFSGHLAENIDETTLDFNDDGKLTVIGGTSSASGTYGIKGDYSTHYGIIECQNGLIRYSVNNMEITIPYGMQLLMPGTTAQDIDKITTIASDIDFEVTEKSNFTLFLKNGDPFQVNNVFYQTEEPIIATLEFFKWKTTDGTKTVYTASVPQNPDERVPAYFDITLTKPAVGTDGFDVFIALDSQGTDYWWYDTQVSLQAYKDNQLAWYNPDTDKWQFKSNSSDSNTWEIAKATPIADVCISTNLDGTAYSITRIDYIGYRVLNKTIFASKDELEQKYGTDNLTAGTGITITPTTVGSNTTYEISANADEIRVDNQTIVQDSATKEISAVGTKLQGTNSVKYDWEGTKEQYDALVNAGTINENWYYNITDDVVAANAADIIKIKVLTEDEYNLIQTKATNVMYAIKAEN